MQAATREELTERYRGLATPELLAIAQSDGLTPVAQTALRAELEGRGIDEERCADMWATVSSGELRRNRIMRVRRALATAVIVIAFGLCVAVLS